MILTIQVLGRFLINYNYRECIVAVLAAGPL